MTKHLFSVEIFYPRVMTSRAEALRKSGRLPSQLSPPPTPGGNGERIKLGLLTNGRQRRRHRRWLVGPTQLLSSLSSFFFLDIVMFTQVDLADSGLQLLRKFLERFELPLPVALVKKYAFSSNCWSAVKMKCCFSGFGLKQHWLCRGMVSRRT